MTNARRTLQSAIPFNVFTLVATDVKPGQSSLICGRLATFVRHTKYKPETRRKSSSSSKYLFGQPISITVWRFVGASVSNNSAWDEKHIAMRRRIPKRRHHFYERNCGRLFEIACHFPSTESWSCWMCVCVCAYCVCIHVIYKICVVYVCVWSGQAGPGHNVSMSLGEPLKSAFVSKWCPEPSGSSNWRRVTKKSPTARRLSLILAQSQMCRDSIVDGTREDSSGGIKSGVPKSLCCDTRFHLIRKKCE